MDCQLLLTTLAGNEVVVSMNIAQFDRFDDFEEHIVFCTGGDAMCAEIAQVILRS